MTASLAFHFMAAEAEDPLDSKKLWPAAVQLGFPCQYCRGDDHQGNPGDADCGLHDDVAGNFNQDDVADE
jgi:hypothetical protein